MRGKILLVGLGVSLVVNVLFSVIICSLQRETKELWALRWKAEGRAKEVEALLDTTSAQLTELNVRPPQERIVNQNVNVPAPVPVAAPAPDISYRIEEQLRQQNDQAFNANMLLLGIQSQQADAAVSAEIRSIPTDARDRYRH